MARTRLVLLALATAGFGLASPRADAAANETAAAKEFLALVNAARTRQGLSPMQMHWDLVDDASRHSARMAAEGRISRLPDLASVTSGWASLSEYEAKAATPARLFAGAMASRQHRAEVLGDYDRVGVGTRANPAGAVYLTVVFMRSAR